MNIVSYGGGTNSTAMIIEMIKRGINPDLILFADTGGEKPHTYRYIDIFNEWLKRNGSVEITIVSGNDPQQIKDKTLENECLRLGCLPSRTYGFGSCAMKWKRRPQDKYVQNNEQYKKAIEDGEEVFKYIGMDADEPHRAERLIEIDDEPYTYKCPLYDWGIGRDGCKSIIKEAGLCMPGKSACFFCPSSKITEIKQLKEVYPDLFKRAIEMEKNADGYNRQIKGLGREFSWSQVVETDDMFSDQYRETEEMLCQCFDGG